MGVMALSAGGRADASNRVRLAGEAMVVANSSFDGKTTTGKTTINNNNVSVAS
jgi:hypothetical protein